MCVPPNVEANHHPDDVREAQRWIGTEESEDKIYLAACARLRPEIERIQKKYSEDLKELLETSDAQLEQQRQRIAELEEQMRKAVRLSREHPNEYALYADEPFAKALNPVNEADAKEKAE